MGMLTYAMMGLLILALAVITLWGVKYQPDKESFMSIEDTTFLRGFWCIIVVLVHVPAMYQNRIQDMLGSFAYIGVTFFFMTSAYGLKWSMEHKPGYMERFWRRRLPSILIPAIIVNLMACCVGLIQKKEIGLFSIININEWVKVLLVCYLIFWLIYSVIPRLVKDGPWQEVVICLIMLIWSIVEQLTGRMALGWEVERLGFLYGILLAKHYDQVNKWIHKRWAMKSLVLLLLSGILGFAYLKFKPIAFYGDFLLRALLGIVLTAFVIVITSGFKVGNRANNMLGSISYEVYLLHTVVFSILAIVVPGINSGVFIISSIILTIIVGYGLNKLTNQMLHIFLHK